MVIQAGLLFFTNQEILLYLEDLQRLLKFNTGKRHPEALTAKYPFIPVSHDFTSFSDIGACAKFCHRVSTVLPRYELGGPKYQFLRWELAPELSSLSPVI